MVAPPSIPAAFTTDVDTPALVVIGLPNKMQMRILSTTTYTQIIILLDFQGKEFIKAGVISSLLIMVQAQKTTMMGLTLDYPMRKKNEVSN